MNSIATDLFEINELYSREPDNLPNPLVNKRMPKIKMIYPIVE